MLVLARLPLVDAKSAIQRYRTLAGCVKFLTSPRTSNINDIEKSSATGYHILLGNFNRQYLYYICMQMMTFH